MDRFFKDYSSILFGASALIFVEVLPLLTANNSSQHQHYFDETSLSAPFVKLYLQEMALKVTSFHDEHLTSLGIQWKKEKGNNVGDDPAEEQNMQNQEQLCSGYLFSRHPQQQHGNQKTSLDPNVPRDYPIMYIPSENPIELNPIPCKVIGYVAWENQLWERPHEDRTSDALVSDATLVHILPPEMLSPLILGLNNHKNNLHQMVGEVKCPPMQKDMEEELLHNNNPGTIRELTLRMSLLLAEPVHIGTTVDALILKRQQQRRIQSVVNSVRTYCSHISYPNLSDDTTKLMATIKPSQNQSPYPTTLPSLMREGALLVHSPHHGAGKTMLVKMIAEKRLQCDSVHIIKPGPLLAKYGSQADAALETTLHAIVLSAAARQQYNGSICIILDHLDAMMSPKLSGKSSAGDAAVPVLNAIASYLKLLILSLKKNREFLFPSKNPLYNLGGLGGAVLSIRVCLVAIVTCPDDGWRSVHVDSGRDIMGHNSCILDDLPLGRYRVPTSSAKTRLKAFQFAFQRQGVHLDDEAQKLLPLLAASAMWCRGNMFQCIAKKLRNIHSEMGNGDDHIHTNITLAYVESAFVSVGNGANPNREITFLGQKEGGGDGIVASDDVFGVVGGNSSAKRSLEDALALDPTRRALLRTMDIGTPVGILLYGPPGNGKTLLAKAVARLLRAPGTAESNIGGAFISLNSSEIIQAEIGSSEKLVVSTFRTARENAPSVIFIDEFQALFTERSRGGTGKLSTTLLQCMDDTKLWRDSNRKAIGSIEGSSSVFPNTPELSDTVLVLAATNTPWMVDKAFLRPGRFDRLVHVGLPSEADRGAILLVYMCDMKVKHDRGIESLCESIAKRTRGFSGADLSALCRAAAVRCLQEMSEWIQERHFLQELETDFVASSNTELVACNELWHP